MLQVNRLTRAWLLGLGLAVALGPAEAAAQSGTLQSLRGTTPVDEISPAPFAKRQNTDSTRLERAYRQQPPLIPHTIDGYQIDIKVNKCLRCHDWPYSEQENAPKLSETHYFDRDGVALDYVSRNRWFCNQCHVPQANARSLVDNRFKSAAEAD